MRASARVRLLVFRAFSRVVRAVSGSGITRVYPIRRVWPPTYSWLLRHTRPEVVQVGEHRMWLDRHDSLRLSIHGVYEPTATRLLGVLIAPGDVFVDVGANIGYFTLLASRRVGPAGHVLAFEPDADNAAVLNRNLTENGITNVTVVQAAVSSKRGTIAFSHSANNAGMHRVTLDNSDSMVPTVALDEYLQGLSVRPRVIKMDIQGAEPLALAGMRALLSGRELEALVAEFWPAGIEDLGHDPIDYLRMLREHFSLVWEIDEFKHILVPATDAELLNAYGGMRERDTALLCARGALAGRLLAVSRAERARHGYDRLDPEQPGARDLQIVEHGADRVDQPAGGDASAPQRADDGRSDVFAG